MVMTAIAILIWSQQCYDVVDNLDDVDDYDGVDDDDCDDDYDDVDDDDCVDDYDGVDGHLEQKGHQRNQCLVP